MEWSRRYRRICASDEKGRLVQSLKSFLTSRSLQTTEVFGRRFKLEELIARILADIRAGAESQFGPTAKQVVVGRPVRFVGPNRTQMTNTLLPV